ncbi:unnamed protein product [Effrenium voratum]|uniref:Uncharacterized protein n=1 Tax=Effrenium voratum TaxID=2562239 RepID=A0AA36MK30_9DINO|nr:unnamed protein product [Effrenium voratum]CAJ1371130.1 unnamed protein product [Effrenium voratum]CAJ1438873.1 unnamed protein product [Effrenium voratum]
MPLMLFMVVARWAAARAQAGVYHEGVDLLQRRLDLEQTNLCNSPIAPEDTIRPIEEVASLRGEDGWCYFGSTGLWARNCGLSRRSKNMMVFVLTYEVGYIPVLAGPWATEKALFFEDGRRMTLRDHDMPLDDAYCFVNGWYNLPRAQVVKNFTFLEEVSEAACKDLEKKVPNYHSITLSDIYAEADQSQAILVELMASSSPVVYANQTLLDNMYFHAATKCALGGGRGALCDIANCAERGCLVGGKLRYTARGECPLIV